MEKGMLYILKEQNNFCMSFVVCSLEGHVLVIDGGEKEDATYLTTFLEGKVVDAWILTHAHPDHICAVNQILTEGKVSIKQFIYHFPPTDFVYKNEPMYAPYQEEFLRLSSETKAQHICPKAGDILTYGSLKIHFLMTSDTDWMHPVLNNHSLVFRIDSPHHRAMFLGDLEPEGGDRFMKLTGGNPELLQADIVQTAHHGHMSIDRSIYEIIKPKIAFWCTPQWLYDESADLIKPRMYGTRMTRKWLEELGIIENYPSYQGTFGIQFD